MSEQTMVQEQLKKVTEELVSALAKNQPLDQYKVSLYVALTKMVNSPGPNMSPNLNPVPDSLPTSEPVTNQGQQTIRTQMFPGLIFGLLPADTTMPPIDHFPALQPLFEEAMAHSKSSALYKTPQLIETSFHYIFNPAGSYQLPQKVEKHSPTAWTLFSQYFRSKGSVDIYNKWEGLGVADKKNWKKLSGELRKERASQKEKGYIIY